MPGYSFRIPQNAANSSSRGDTRHNYQHQETLETVDEEDYSIESEIEGEHDHGGETNKKRASQGWGRGIVSDFKSTIGTHWAREMANFNTKTIAVPLFLFIAVIAPTITFGAVYAKKTNHYMGTVELLFATAWGGIFYSLVSGMPMMMNGGGGLMLTYQAVLYDISSKLDIPFLPFNAWVGIWLALYLILAGILDINRWINHATRFTHEIYALLVIAIYILDAIGSPTSKVGLFHYFNPDHPHHGEQEGDEGGHDIMAVALLSLNLGLGTAFFAIGLRFIRYSAFCCNDYVRSVITDFAITISVLFFTLLKHTVFADIPTEELDAPDSFSPTFTCCTADCSSHFPTDCPDQEEGYGSRPWIVNIFDLNGKTSWAIFIAAGAAVPAFILAFLDHGITWHMLNHPSNMLKHGDAYNYDTCITAIMIAVNSILGLPWLQTFTVPSIMHISAMSEKTKEGATVKVQETRLTGLFTGVVVLGTCFALNIIKLAPMPVLYGVFLFMGIVALPAQQFWQRIVLFFQQPSMLTNKAPWTEYLKLKRIHLFTLVQLVFFAMMYTVKNMKAIAMAFPLMIFLCIPARLYLLPKIFSKDELTLLDGSPEAIERWMRKHTMMFGGGGGKAVTVVGVKSNSILLPEDIEASGKTMPVDDSFKGRFSFSSSYSCSEDFSPPYPFQRRPPSTTKGRTSNSNTNTLDDFMAKNGLVLPDHVSLVEQQEEEEEEEEEGSDEDETEGMGEGYEADDADFCDTISFDSYEENSGDDVVVDDDDDDDGSEDDIIIEA